jgi:hypothetical protein
MAVQMPQHFSCSSSFRSSSSIPCMCWAMAGLIQPHGNVAIALFATHWLEGK